jgi:hypothetical protein
MKSYRYRATKARLLDHDGRLWCAVQSDGTFLRCAVSLLASQQYILRDLGLDAP